MTRRLVVIGAGAFGRDVLDVVEAMNESGQAERIEVVGLLDDAAPPAGVLEPYGVTHLGPVSALEDLDPEVDYVIGIADPATRRRIDEVAGTSGRQAPVLVHPRAWVGPRVVALGAGTVICAHASITNHVTLGRHVHVNIGSTIGHDAVLEDYVTLSPMVAISGNVHVERESFFGTGATVNPGVAIGRGSAVGAGAAVIRDVEPGQTVVGVPARPLCQ